MKEVRSFNNATEAYFAAGLLQPRGISCEVRDNPVSEQPPFMPSLWILNDTDLTAAAEVLNEKRDVHGWPWSCPKCKTENEATFDACWSCGADRPRP